MPIFEVQAIVNGESVSHVAEYESAETARAESEKHLEGGTIEAVLELEGLYGDTRRLAAARLDQDADDGYLLL